MPGDCLCPKGSRVNRYDAALMVSYGKEPPSAWLSSQTLPLSQCCASLLETMCCARQAFGLPLVLPLFCYYDFYISIL